MEATENLESPQLTLYAIWDPGADLHNRTIPPRTTRACHNTPSSLLAVATELADEVRDVVVAVDVPPPMKRNEVDEDMLMELDADVVRLHPYRSVSTACLISAII